MPIYLQYEGIDGEVTESGHAKWIEIQSFSWGCGRSINTTLGAAQSREASSPSVGEIQLSKQTDIASPKLFMESVVGEAKKAVIEFVQTSGTAQDVFLRYELTNTLISSYSISGGGDGRPGEGISLNFSKVEMKFTPFDDKHKAGSPIPVGYNISEGKKV